MAKTKTTKLSDAQIEQFVSLKKETRELNYELGRLERQKWIIEKSIKSLLERITDYDEREKKLLESVQEEFGDGRLDLSSYEFVKSE